MHATVSRRLGGFAAPLAVPLAAEPDSGDTAWILTATALVLFMTLPGLALFYGGLVRSRHMFSVLMHCVAIAWKCQGPAATLRYPRVWPRGEHPTMPEDPPRTTSVRHPRSLAATARGADRWLGLYFVAVSALLIAGWTLPIMTVHKLVFFAEEVSILEGARQLWEAGNYFLCVVVAAFSVAFPALKMLVALTLWYGADARGPDLAGLLHWLEGFGRWSMLDVFVVALTIVAVEISIISDVTTHAGLYVFTAAVVLSMAGVRRLVVLARRAVAAERDAPR